MAPARRKPGDGFFGHKPNHKNGGRPSPGNFLPKQKSGRAELALQPQAAPAAAHEALADCVEESERVLNMLNTLLDITEAEAGMMKLRRERVDLCRMVREVVELYEYVADERKVTVRTGRHHAEIGKVSVAVEMARPSANADSRREPRLRNGRRQGRLVKMVTRAPGRS